MFVDTPRTVCHNASIIFLISGKRRAAILYKEEVVHMSSYSINRTVALPSRESK